MAERTGVSEIDLLLEEFQGGTFRDYDHLPQPPDGTAVNVLRWPARAKNRCELVSEQLVDFLRSRGLDQAGREAYVSGDEWDGGEMVIERITPEHFGYQDRPVEGCGSHVVCQVDWDGQRFMVDFTAAQYGYREFPMVQRLIGDQCDWERDFLPSSDMAAAAS